MNSELIRHAQDAEDDAHDCGRVDVSSMHRRTRTSRVVQQKQRKIRLKVSIIKVKSSGIGISYGRP
jgi:hypothetical protein